MSQDIKASKNIGANIQKARIAAGLTQDKLAAKMQTEGCDISRGTLAKIEAGIRHISLEELKTVKQILNVDFDNLLEQ